jgi:hypothetical protein
LELEYKKKTFKSANKESTLPETFQMKEGESHGLVVKADGS